MIISFQEILDMAIMTFFVGFIFKDAFVPRQYYADVVDYYTRKRPDFWEGFYPAVLATVPGIVFHELAHKFFALGFNMNAVFHAAYFWLGIGLLLKLLNFGLIFFVPGYVSISGLGTNLQLALVAFAGPLMNLLLWGISYLLLKKGFVRKKYLPIFVMSKKINLFLFFFNMLPVPPFDGFSVFYNLFKAFF